MAIRQKTTITVKMSGKGTSHARSEISSQDLTAAIDEPIERGGTNTGFSPTETAYSALVAMIGGGIANLAIRWRERLNESSPFLRGLFPFSI